jgi:hypothetical protein
MLRGSSPKPSYGYESIPDTMADFKGKKIHKSQLWIDPRTSSGYGLM